jgi:DNA polymerase V
MKEKVFALVDCNNFYCSCERLFQPQLRHVPVVVLSNNDGCIVARSKEVKDLGIGMGVPLFKAREQIDKHGIQVFSSNYTLYGDISQRVMQTLESFASHVEIYSIDEAFLDLTGFPDLFGYGELIKRQVYNDVGIPVSVGIGPTKTLAKLANHSAKRIFPDIGVVDFTDVQLRQSLMPRIPVGEVWGVGRRIGEKLSAMGITTVQQLAQMRPKVARSRFSVNVERTVRELNGLSCIDLDESTVPKKQIVCSRSFGNKITEYQPLRQAVSEFVARAAEKLRKEQQHAAALTLFIRTSPFDKHGQHYSNSATATLLQASSDTRTLLTQATRLFDAIWQEGPRYGKAGVMLGDFSPETELQLPLVEQRTDSVKSDLLMRTIDKINKTGGSVWFGGQRPEKDWFMRQAKLSPAYTTRWDCLPLVS